MNPYQLDEYISKFSGFWCIFFYFDFIFDRVSCKQTV